MLVWPLCCESEAVLSKRFHPSDQAGLFICEIFMKKRVVRRNHRNQASPVDGAYMKWP